MSRVSLRLRLTLAFALAMAALLAVVGALLYVRLGDSLQEQVDDGLEVRAGALSALVLESGVELESAQLEAEEGLAQVLGPGARVVSSPSVDAPLISASERARALDGPFLLTRESAPGVDGEARLHVSAIDGVAAPQILVVGASLEDRQEALDGLLSELLVVGPLALVLASLAGYLLAGAALHPVEAMRRTAEEISSERLDRRLPLPEADDEVRRLGETLNEMLARLEDGLVRERRFVADASHELRTPLASLQTELELALRRPRSPEELEDALRSARDEVERLVSLAEDLLVLARTEDGRLPLRPTRNDAREVLDSVARRFEPRVVRAGRLLEVVAPAGETVLADRVRLEQALGNLVDNALRHGGGTIRLEAACKDGSILLRVGDGGAGFPPEFLPRALERFTRADRARSGGGAGLGLAIVDVIARAHGGSVTVANRPGDGAVVELRVPTEPPSS